MTCPGGNGLDATDMPGGRQTLVKGPGVGRSLLPIQENTGPGLSVGRKGSRVKCEPGAKLDDGRAAFAGCFCNVPGSPRSPRSAVESPPSSRRRREPRDSRARSSCCPPGGAAGAPRGPPRAPHALSERRGPIQGGQQAAPTALQAASPLCLALLFLKVEITGAIDREPPGAWLPTHPAHGDRTHGSRWGWTGHPESSQLTAAQPQPGIGR